MRPECWLLGEKGGDRAAIRGRIEHQRPRVVARQPRRDDPDLVDLLGGYLRGPRGGEAPPGPPRALDPVVHPPNPPPVGPPPPPPPQKGPARPLPWGRGAHPAPQRCPRPHAA